jgi:hypothetical protein
MTFSEVITVVQTYKNIFTESNIVFQYTSDDLQNVHGNDVQNPPVVSALPNHQDFNFTFAHDTISFQGQLSKIK